MIDGSFLQGASFDVPLSGTAGRWDRATRHGRVTAERRLLRNRRQHDRRTDHRTRPRSSGLPRP